MASRSGSDMAEMDLLLRFDNTYLYNSTFSGPGLTGKHFCILVTEVWNGVPNPTDTVFSTLKYEEKVGRLETDTFRMRVMARQIEKDVLKIWFNTDNFGSVRTYQTTASDQYQLEATGHLVDIKLNEKFPAYVYLLPIDKDGLSYCGITESGEDVYNWGKEFNLPHYIIFEMVFVEPPIAKAH
jgi:hypothetical protein